MNQNRNSSWYFGSILICFGIYLFSDPAYSKPIKSSRLEPHDGYILTVDEEDGFEYSEILLPLEPIPQLPVKSWFKKIFDDDELGREFKDRYERQFGRTEAEQAQGISNPYVVIDIINPQGQLYRGTAVQGQAERQQFAEYMVRRMVEHNIDKFVKSDPNIRPIYEIKERISKAEVAVAPGYSFALNYSFSANNLLIRPINPYFIFEVLLQMIPTQFGPGDVIETHWRIGRQLTKTFSLNSYYRQTDGIASLVFRQQTSPWFAKTLTLSTYTKPEGPSPRENLILVGMYYQF